MPEWNRETPWRQGHLLDAKAIDALGLHHFETPELTLVMVITHDCDLAQDPGLEPLVEVVVGRHSEKDGNYTHGKNARKLHIEFSGDANVWGEFEATAKKYVSKTDLNNFFPREDARLSSENRAITQAWLASRYRRSAFADEFERRLTKETRLADKISKIVKPHGELIAGIFFDVDDGLEVIRDGPNDTYSLDIVILHVSEPDFMAAETAATIAAEAIAKAFSEKLFDPTKTWQHIELRSCDVVSESVLSYQEFKQLKRWRLEHISLAADPQQPVLAE